MSSDCNRDAGAFGYYVNADRPDRFFADVRNTEGRTVYEIHDRARVPELAMRNARDVDGLRRYLIRIGLLPARMPLLLMAA